MDDAVDLAVVVVVLLLAVVPVVDDFTVVVVVSSRRGRGGGGARPRIGRRGRGRVADLCVLLDDFLVAEGVDDPQAAAIRPPTRITTPIANVRPTR